MPKLFKAPFYTEEQEREMGERDMCFPYSTKYMRYDSVKRQYMPTEALLLRHGVDLSEYLQTTSEYTPTRLANELERISDQVYSFIYRNSGSNADTLKYMVAKGIRLGMSSYRFRVMFEVILWKQARFYVDNDDILRSSGVDIESKQWLNKGVMQNEGRNIDPQVKEMLKSLGLCWIGSYDKQFFCVSQREDW